MVKEQEPQSADELARRIRVPVEVWAVVQRMVEEEAISIADIARQTGLPESTISTKIKREGWLRKWQLAHELARSQPDERKRLIARLYAAFEKQVGALEAKLKKLSGAGEVGAGEMDATAKALTSLAKTLDMLIDLQETHGIDTAKEVDDEQMRQQLSQRIESLCEAGKNS
ncbi:hypothetical protein PsAD2_00963 [Pseudovibrio axinellae]|uniref:Uncharacterized protein n=1 Tax=Pseudovibrio axinellae TaxID=989403 RepID=A0A166AEM6_9HYPH|nr:hypothetical protein [Pseudovibrio axinellae]KZL20971.1 hypothetical protein PsAD2_00963 [Pseudovibrio axinellae]SEP80790.1 hypothetical protein SAMN05421798_101438 [Pseudovibrio axinellae]